MKLRIEERIEPQIDDGDIVDYNGVPCLVVILPGDVATEGWSYCLIGIKRGVYVAAFNSMKALRQVCKLLIKGHEAVIVRELNFTEKSCPNENKRKFFK